VIPKSATVIASFVAFVAMIAVFVGYIASLGLRVSPPTKRTTLSMAVADVNNLVAGSSVLLRGVPVGKVTAVDTSVSAANVQFYIADQYKVPVDSDVRLENLSALGESYIELEPRSSGGPTFRDGERIKAGAVKQPPSITELATSVVRVLNQLDPKQLGNVVGEADVALPDPSTVLPNLARASLLTRNTVAGFKGQGRELLDNFQVLLRNAGFVGPALAGAAAPVRDLGPVFNIVWSHALEDLLMGVYPATIVQLSDLLTRIQKFLDDRGTDLKVLGEATSSNVVLIANALKNLDSSQILSNLLATVPEDGAIELHVPIPGG
jgi:phospholipid/cholesterol/gamma-HCH transport system substrate-binding protein